MFKDYLCFKIGNWGFFWRSDQIKWQFDLLSQICSKLFAYSLPEWCTYWKTYWILYFTTMFWFWKMIEIVLHMCEMFSDIWLDVFYYLVLRKRQIMIYEQFKSELCSLFYLRWQTLFLQLIGKYLGAKQQQKWILISAMKFMKYDCVIHI